MLSATRSSHPVGPRHMRSRTFGRRKWNRTIDRVTRVWPSRAKGLHKDFKPFEIDRRIPELFHVREKAACLDGMDETPGRLVATTWRMLQPREADKRVVDLNRVEVQRVMSEPSSLRKSFGIENAAAMAHCQPEQPMRMSLLRNTDELPNLLWDSCLLTLGGPLELFGASVVAARPTMLSHKNRAVLHRGSPVVVGSSAT